MLNNIDRQMLGLIKPLLDQEFGWPGGTYSRITAASQISAALCLPLMGWIADKVSARHCLAWGVAAWSALTAAQAMASGMQSMLIVRVSLTGAEAIGTPAALKMLGRLAPARRRAFALGLFNMAPSLGAMIGPVVVPLLAWSFGWRWAALAMGGLGLLWVLWWLRVAPADPAPVMPEPGIARHDDAVLRRPATWLLIAAKGLTDQLWWVFLYWLPVFLHQSGSDSVTGWAGSVTGIYIWAALGSLIGAFVLPHWRSGPSLRAQLSIAVCSLAVAGLLLLATAPVAVVSVAAFALAIFGHQVISVLIFSQISDNRHRARTGTIAGIAAFVGNMLAVGSVTLVGQSVAAGMGQAPALIGLAAAYALGGACMVAARMLSARRSNCSPRLSDYSAAGDHADGPVLMP
ncbi:MFS transporter [Sphingomonas sp. M1-B02]|uniref:MFS transporter n=1 Tax=Sphingomonas sp. M1-B02 TaxID=3114300 RepID=UPI00223F1C86|nr:MFS transporter [Sphingomonas sp. S6-11]UZK67046.1 MFS transporter [Sphingomonas sp. S6-11]